MKKRNLILFFFFLEASCGLVAQDFFVSEPRLEFDGSNLLIYYDLLSRNQKDKFYVWVELYRKNGELINAKAFRGDAGEFVSAGQNKMITWTPGDDRVFLDEEISVEVKAERYLKEFKRGSILLMSAALPGLGQTKASRGKPWWLAGLAVYGAAVGGFLINRSYLNTYDQYVIEEDPAKRTDLYDKAQQKYNLSNALLLSAAAAWAANIVWTAAVPNRYRPLQNVKVSVNNSVSSANYTPLLTLRLNF